MLCALRSAVCQFNSDSMSYGGKLKLLGLPVSDTQASHMNQKDRERVRKTEKAAEVQVREARHVRHVANHEAHARLETAEGVQLLCRRILGEKHYFFSKTCCNNVSYNSPLIYDCNLLIELENVYKHSFERVFA